jgi:tubulin polyglutamylase TTLL7
LTKTGSNIDRKESYVAQEYISNPMLIEGHKFDLRVYVLLVSVDPITMYLYDDGLTRLCTEKYDKPTSGNLDNLFMHLTNYSINKHSEKVCR